MTFDSAKWRQVRNEKLLDWMCGNRDAVDFLLALFAAAELWDDLSDGDFDKAKKAADAVFLTLLVDLPNNPFFLNHLTSLRSVMLAGINAWLDSRKLEKECDQWATVWAYALRDWYMELVPFCAMLVGGYAHMRQVSLDVRRFFQAETLQEYTDGRAN